MTRRLVLGYLSVTVVVLLILQVPLAVFYAQRERDRLADQVVRDANVLATLYEDDLEADRPLDPGIAERYQARTGARVVVTDDAGVSRVDTEQPVPRDLSTRPEVAAALSGDTSSGIRSSDTLGTDLLYVAVPVASSGVVHGVVRVTLDASRVQESIRRFWWSLAAVAVVVLAAMTLVGWAVATSVTRPLRELRDAATRFARGDLDAAINVHGPPETRQLATTMQTMAVQLDDLLTRQRTFVADASHQLRTPLTALRLRLENLQSRMAAADPADDVALGQLDAAIDETERLATLVGDLLRLARADRPDLPARVDVAAIVRDRVDTWTAVAETAGIELSVSGADRPAFGLAVAGGIEQLLDNLLDNALAAGPVGSVVHVDIDRGADGIVLDVRDHGPGLSDDDKLAAVGRFWRGSTAHPGTGLGLPIAVAIAEAGGGSLSLLDAPGGGLLVRVVIPSG